MGAIVLRQKLSRGQVDTRLANMPPCLIGTEACVGTHHLSRQLKALGHDARLMPARYVRPYSRGQKNDFRDAEAIAEAVLRPTMKFVAIKTVEQLDLQALHRVRERLVCQRTSVINQIRAFLLERGIAVRQGLRALRTEMPIVLAMTDKLSPRMIRMIEDLCTDWRHLDARIATVSNEIKTLSEQDDGAKRLMTVPGIGPIISTATVAAIGSGDVFSKGRDFGAWLGLVPRQMSTGGRTVLGPISKRGNRYLRMLFLLSHFQTPANSQRRKLAQIPARTNGLSEARLSIPEFHSTANAMENDFLFEGSSIAPGQTSSERQTSCTPYRTSSRSLSCARQRSSSPLLRSARRWRRMRWPPDMAVGVVGAVAAVVLEVAVEAPTSAVDLAVVAVDLAVDTSVVD
jgi:transposase